MLASAFALSAGVAIRAASLNLCSDEYLLLLANPGEVVSVTHLARDPAESLLWAKAKSIPANRGTIEEVIRFEPRLVLTMGSGGRATGTITQRLGIRLVDLKAPQNLADVAANLRRVATALGEPRRADPWLARLRRLQFARPPEAVDSAFVGSGGRSLAADSLGAQWLRLAGYRQRSLPGNRLTLEIIATNAPMILIKSNYRSDQFSLGSGWFRHPLVQRLNSRSVVTDGRAWTCMGPQLIPEIERLRSLRR